jgi:hypothetical protein
VTAFNGGRSLSSRFPNCPRASATTTTEPQQFSHSLINTPTDSSLVLLITFWHGRHRKHRFSFAFYVSNWSATLARNIFAPTKFERVMLEMCAETRWGRQILTEIGMCRQIFIDPTSFEAHGGLLNGSHVMSWRSWWPDFFRVPLQESHSVVMWAPSRPATVNIGTWTFVNAELCPFIARHLFLTRSLLSVSVFHMWCAEAVTGKLDEYSKLIKC